MTSTKNGRQYHALSKKISTPTPIRVDIINVRLILHTSKKDTSVDNPVSSHPMVYPFNKDLVQILPIPLLSHQKFHIDQQI